MYQRAEGEGVQNALAIANEGFNEPNREESKQPIIESFDSRV